MSPAYTYRAVLERIIDGDSCVLTVDVGFRVYVSVMVRLRDVNCPEARAPGGPEATAFLTDLLTGRDLLIESYRDRRSFARWVCDVWVAGDEARAIRPRSVAEALVEAGHGVAVAP